MKNHLDNYKKAVRSTYPHDELQKLFVKRDKDILFIRATSLETGVEPKFADLNKYTWRGFEILTDSKMLLVLE